MEGSAIRNEIPKVTSEGGPLPADRPLLSCHTVKIAGEANA